MRRLGVSSSLTRLPFADAAFVGRGKGDAPWQVGVELKTISDLASCILTGRFAGHQLPGLLAGYDDVWLCVEGRWRARPDGVLEVDQNGRGYWYTLTHGRQRWMYRDVVNYLHSVAMLSGVRIWRTESRDETARWLAALHNWWTGKAIEQHKALQAFAEVPLVRTDARGLSAVALVAPGFEQRVYAQFPGCGFDKAREMAKAMPTLVDALVATEKDWAQVPGIGKVLAARIVAAIQGQHRHKETR